MKLTTSQLEKIAKIMFPKLRKKQEKKEYELAFGWLDSVPKTNSFNIQKRKTNG